MSNPQDSGAAAGEPRPRRSQLRAALDAATGADRDDVGDLPVLPGPAADAKSPRRRFGPFFGNVASNTLGGLLVLAIAAMSACLWAYLHHPAPAAARPGRPAATTPAARPSNSSAPSPAKATR
jgi:hypothetical protein